MVSRSLDESVRKNVLRRSPSTHGLFAIAAEADDVEVRAVSGLSM